MLKIFKIKIYFCLDVFGHPVKYYYKLKNTYLYYIRHTLEKKSVKSIILTAPHVK